MSFLKFSPTVFVIGDEYEIAVTTEATGIIWLTVGGEDFYPENSGVLSTEKCFAKIRVPEKKLDASRAYTVNFRESLNRKAYFSMLGEREREEFDFRPLEKTEGINIYHIADVHYNFGEAKKIAKFFGENTDLFILNGDIGEVETVNNYMAVLRFVGDISCGRVPVLFVRGNHDTRGRLAELYTEYFPANGSKTYFTFKLGPISGIALDCGEDKPDAHKEYNGVNIFELYRRGELEFLRSLSGRYDFAVSHIPPAMVAESAGSQFDIEREVYSEWNKELSRLGVKFMLSGHFHKTFILEKNDSRSLLLHDYPVIVGSANDDVAKLLGAALTLNSDSVEVSFTDSEQKIREQANIKF